MKSVNFIFLFLVCFSLANAQNYKIVYRHCVQIDTTKVITDTLGMEATLIGNNVSSNYSFLKMKEDPQKNISETDAKMNNTTIEKIISEKKSGTFALKVGVPVDAIGNMVFWNKKTDSVFVREKMMNQYVVTREKLPEIKWQITEEARKIQNYTCIKATTEYRGRNYIAWFTPDLPIAEGPWKFKGLPGLVISISDDEGQVKIYATQVEFPAKDPVPAFSANGKPVSLSEYFTFLNGEMNMQVKNVESIFAGQPEIQGTNQPVMNPRMKKRMYYRIEKRF